MPEENSIGRIKLPKVHQIAGIERCEPGSDVGGYRWFVEVENSGWAPTCRDAFAELIGHLVRTRALATARRLLDEMARPTDAGAIYTERE
jgi:hypothetical protein